ncbi:MAG: oligosaccharide flippase family protein [Bacteroidales bacterium]|nr:oligosaccharide flippase family protein [Bacteroidales bacterium]
MQDKLIRKKIVTTVHSNKKIIENYFFMTVLQVINSLFYLLIYPFLIRVLGADSYGHYVFAMSITNFFITFVSFGFELPAMKAIAQNQMDVDIKTNVLSCVFTGKIYIEVLAFIIYFILITLVPVLRQDWILLSICFINTLSNIIFPNWYFQGMQKMQVVTFIQLAFRLFSLPFIFLIIRDPADVLIFAFITTLTNIGGGAVAAHIIHFKEKLHIHWMPIFKLKIWYKDALPFFWSTALSSIKYQSISVILGSFFRMSDVALYDLAYKIISIPNILFGSINGALFPKIAKDNNKKIIKRIFKFETLAGIFVILIVTLLGRWIIIFLGGSEMLGAYQIAVVMSFGVLTLLLVGGYINFIFVPQKKYNLVLQNQIVAFCVFFTLIGLGLIICKSILSFAIAWSTAGIFEIFYCKILIKRHKLF